jgi:hypothetical protein
MGLYDVMDSVEDYMGTDVRQYLEGYIEEVEAPEEEVSLDEHFIDVLDNFECKVREIETAVGGKRTDRKGIQEALETMKKMIERERARGNR